MNGESLVGADHYDAVDVLKTAGNNIVMVLGREKVQKFEVSGLVWSMNMIYMYYCRTDEIDNPVFSLKNMKYLI